MSVTPAYRLIAKTLRRQIRAGDYLPGDHLPSLRQLATDHRVSEIVARQAIRELSAEGLVRTEQGRRSVVTELTRFTLVFPDRHRLGHGTTTYSDEGEQFGLVLRPDWETSYEEASDDLAERLGIDVGDRLVRTNYRFRASEARRHIVVSMSSCWEPYDLVGGSDIEMPMEGPHSHLGVVDRFARIGVPAVEVEDRVTVRAATTEEVTELRHRAMVVEVWKSFLGHERTLHISKIRYNPHRYFWIYRAGVPNDETPLDPDDHGEIGPGFGLPGSFPNDPGNPGGI